MNRRATGILLLAAAGCFLIWTYRSLDRGDGSRLADHALPADSVPSNPMAMKPDTVALPPVVPPSSSTSRSSAAAHDWRSMFSAGDGRVTQSYREAPEVALSRYQELSSAASAGDAPAALALHQLAEYCGLLQWQRREMMSSMDAQCQRVAASLAVATAEWLGRAAKAGDLEAAIALLNDAINAHRYQGDLAVAQDLSSRATSALEDAAAAGHLHAVRLLWAVYENGLLGEPNSTKAYAYLEIYARATEEEAVTKRAEKSRSLLRQADFAVVQEIQEQLANRLKDKARIQRKALTGG